MVKSCDCWQHPSPLLLLACARTMPTTMQIASCDATPAPRGLFVLQKDRDSFRCPSRGSVENWIDRRKWNDNERQQTLTMFGQHTLYNSACFLNSTTSLYNDGRALLPLAIALLFNALLSANPKSFFSVWSFLNLFSVAYCETGRTDVFLIIASRLRRLESYHSGLFEY